MPFFGIWEKPGLSICVNLWQMFWQMRKTFWNTSTDSVTLGNSEALGKMQKESEKGFTQLIEKLGFVGRPRWPQDYTLYNFDELPPFGKVAVYCCILRMLCLLCHFSKLISTHCIDGGRWWIKNSLSRNPSFHVFILIPKSPYVPSIWYPHQCTIA